MTFTVEHSDPALILLSGNVLGGPEAMEFSQGVKGCVEKGTPNVIVDLSGVEVMNSSGLGMLVAASRTLSAADGMLALVGAGEKLQKLFAMTRLDSVFRQFGTREEAVAALNNR